MNMRIDDNCTGTCVLSDTSQRTAKDIPNKCSNIKKTTEKWTWRDLNPRPLRCERNDLPLIYKPATSHIGARMRNLDLASIQYKIIFLRLPFSHHGGSGLTNIVAEISPQSKNKRDQRMISISSFSASSLYLFLIVTSVTPATSATSRCVRRSPPKIDEI